MKEGRSGGGDGWRMVRGLGSGGSGQARSGQGIAAAELGEEVMAGALRWGGGRWVGTRLPKMGQAGGRQGHQPCQQLRETKTNVEEDREMEVEDDILAVGLGSDG